MSDPVEDGVQRWTYDADVGMYCRMEDGNFMLLPHGTAMVTEADHVAAVQAEREAAGKRIESACLAAYHYDTSLDRLTTARER